MLRDDTIYQQGWYISLLLLILILAIINSPGFKLAKSLVKVVSGVFFSFVLNSE